MMMIIYSDSGEEACEFVYVGGNRDRLSAGRSHPGGWAVEPHQDQQEKQGGGGERGERQQRH